METFINAFFYVLFCNNFFFYPLGFALIIACFGLVFKLFKYESGGNR